jgi:DNA-binding response OmpR family regulator
MNKNPDVAVRPPRILIVDDERDNRELLSVILAHEGFAVATAGGGEEALAAVAVAPPDLILLDLMMPGMSGYDVVARLKANIVTENIPIIIVTALHDRAARTLAVNAGADDFLTKPVDRAELCARIKSLLLVGRAA